MRPVLPCHVRIELLAEKPKMSELREGDRGHGVYPKEGSQEKAGKSQSTDTVVNSTSFRSHQRQLRRSRNNPTQQGHYCFSHDDILRLYTSLSISTGERLLEVTISPCSEPPLGDMFKSKEGQENHLRTRSHSSKAFSTTSTRI